MGTSAAARTRPRRLRWFAFATTVLVTIAMAGLASPAVAAPPAPTIGTATAGDGQASVSFSAATGTDFTATSSPGGLTASGASSPLTVTGLTNGTTHTFTVTATDATGTSTPSGTSNAVTPLSPPVTIAPTSLPAGAVGTAYDQTLTSSGGTAPYTYAVTAGALPAGLTLSAAGHLTGTPTAGGIFNVTVTARDSGSALPGSHAYTMTVLAPTVGLSPSTLATATAGAAYSQTITASGGTAPYSYSLTAGAIPAGLTLSSAGVLSGTPTMTGNFTFTVTAADSSTGAAAPYTGLRTYTLGVDAPTIVLAPPTLPDGTAETAYSQTLTASGGRLPYAYAVTAGALPTGVFLSGAGLLSGTPTSTGAFNFTVTATDSSSYTGSQSYTLTVVPPTITITPATLPPAAPGVAYHRALAGAGGSAPYVFTVSSGSLPPGLVLGGGGVISGTSTSVGSYTFGVTVDDAGGFAGTQNYTMIVAVPPPPGTAPSITLQPGDESVETGEPATFTAAASGDPVPGVQWQQLILGSWTDIAGATDPTLTLPDATSGQDQTRYRAVFTNSLGSATSDPATLTVTQPTTPPIVVPPPATHANFTSHPHARFHPGRHHRFAIRTDAPAGTRLTSAGRLPKGLHLRIHGDQAVLVGTAVHPTHRVLRLALHRTSATGPVIARQRLTVIVSAHRLVPLPDIVPTGVRPLRHIPRHIDPGQKLVAIASHLARRTPATIAIYTASGHRIIGYDLTTRERTLSSVFMLPPDIRGPVTIVVATRAAGSRPTYLVARTETGP